MGLDPSFLWKLCKEELYEEAAQYGLLRCSRCGLCSYTCPSKLDLATTIFRGKEKWLETLMEEAS